MCIRIVGLVLWVSLLMVYWHLLGRNWQSWSQYTRLLSLHAAFLAEIVCCSCLPKRLVGWFKSNSNNKAPKGTHGVLRVWDFGKSMSKCDCVCCNLFGSALSPGLGPNDLQRSFPSEIILRFCVGIGIQVCCLSGCYFYATGKISVEINWRKWQRLCIESK